MKKILGSILVLLICSLAYTAYSADRITVQGTVQDADKLSGHPPALVDKPPIKLAKVKLSAKKYKVYGTVRLSRGTPVAGVTVSLYQKQNKAQLLQGAATTNRNGAYSIVYPPRSDPKGVSIFIRVTDRTGARLYQSPTIGRAKKSQQLNAVLP